MFSAVLSFLFLAAVVGAAYWWILRPVPRAKPELKESYAKIDGFWAWLNERTRGLRTIILALLVQLGWGVIALHDTVIPYVAGVDWTPISARVLAFVPPDLRTLALSAFGILCGGPEHGRAGTMSEIVNMWFFLSVVAICATILLSQWTRS